MRTACGVLLGLLAVCRHGAVAGAPTTHAPVFTPLESPLAEAPANHLSRVDADQFELRNASVTDELFATWKSVHSKQYESAQEEATRRAVFQRNAALVAAHNSRPDSTYTMEVNQFADLTWSEIQSMYLSAPQNCSATHTSGTPIHYGIVPEARDWFSEGVVTRVKSQGICGSCWAFSATGCLESHTAIKHGSKVLLSEQNLIDCAQAFENHGCRGGLPSQAFEYVHFNGGLDRASAYPYKGKGQTCHFDPSHVGARVSAIVNITSRNEDELTAAVGTVGPVSIAFQAMLDFMFYKSGVYESTKCHSEEKYVDHAVLVVGYSTTDNGVPYWIVKNSWSDKWGMDGYFLIKRGVNMCGLADCASYAIIE